MMKKLLYYASLVLLPFFGIGLDFLTQTLRHYTGLTFNTVPINLFYVGANILLMLFVILLSINLTKIPLSKPISLIFLISGLVIVGEPILFLIGFDPLRFLLSFAGFPIYTYLAGAFLFIAGMINIFFRKKENI